MLIDCDSCRVRDVGCSDCVISLLLSTPDISHDLVPAEAAAFTALAGAGIVPPLRLVSSLASHRRRRDGPDAGRSRRASA